MPGSAQNHNSLRERLSSLGPQEVRAVSLQHAISETGMTAIGQFAFLTELENYDVADVQLGCGIECHASFAKVGADGLVGFFHQQAIAENPQWNLKSNAFAQTAVESRRQLRDNGSALGRLGSSLGRGGVQEHRFRQVIGGPPENLNSPQIRAETSRRVAAGHSSHSPCCGAVTISSWTHLLLQADNSAPG
jgi:hypothetical protein